MTQNSTGARFVLAPDLLTLERDLLAAVDEVDAQAREKPELFAASALLVVPSKSLAEHLRRQLVSGGAVRLGWRVVTLFDLAASVSAAAGETLRPGDLALDLALRRAARDDDFFSGTVARSEDGLDVLAGSVRDLLDVGFEEVDFEPWNELFVGQVESERIAALFRVALRVRADLREQDRLDRGSLLRHAAELLERNSELLDARAIFVHGFADATFGATQLLRALSRSEVARIWIERPPGPNSASVERFLERIHTTALESFGQPHKLEAAVSQATVSTLDNRDRADECDRIARSIKLECEGASALQFEDIGILARDPLPYRAPLERALRRHGVPFSGSGLRRGPGGAARKIDALLSLIGEGVDAPLELCAATFDHDARELLAFQVAGAARVRDLARVDWKAHLSHAAAQTIKLPLRAPDEQGQLSSVSVDLDQLDRATSNWHALALAAGELAKPKSWAEHREHLTRWVQDDLRWKRGAQELELLLHALDQVDRELDSIQRLTALEFARVVRRTVERVGAAAWGGAGGGVQVLSTTEARGRTFKRLFIVGLNRGAFPRLAPEDPLLADSLRGQLTTFVAEFPIKARSYDEERHLFASLVHASSAVTLSWCTDDGEGRPLGPSPMVERFARERGAAPLDVERTEHPDLVTALGLSRQKAAWQSGLAASLGKAEADHVAATIAEYELRADPPRLGPWSGMLGRTARPERLYITHLEAWQGCPWRMFLERILRLEPRPDPAGTLPSIDHRTLGIVVHETIERSLGVLANQRGDTTAILERARKSKRKPTPTTESLREVARETADRLGVRWSGFAEALERRALPYLDAFQKTMEISDTEPLVAEIESSLDVAAGSWGRATLAFRADLVEERDGELLVTDIKTGKKLHSRGNLPVKPETRRVHLLLAVKDGSRLQAVAYSRGFGDKAHGRYVFLDPKLTKKPEDRDAVADPDDTELGEAFDRSVAATLDGMARGIHTPRLRKRSKTDFDVNPNCAFCEVRTACTIGDSTQTARFEALSDARTGTREASSDTRTGTREASSDARTGTREASSDAQTGTREASSNAQTGTREASPGAQTGTRQALSRAQTEELEAWSAALEPHREDPA